MVSIDSTVYPKTNANRESACGQPVGLIRFGRAARALYSVGEFRSSSGETGIRNCNRPFLAAVVASGINAPVTATKLLLPCCWIPVTGRHAVH